MILMTRAWPITAQVGFACTAMIWPANAGADGRCEPTWVSLYGKYKSVSAAVLTVVEYDDGSGPALIAGGAFTMIEGDPVNRVARWNGYEWTALSEGFNGDVYQLIVHDDGSGPTLFAGGAFTSADGEPAVGLAKWEGGRWTGVGGGAWSGGHPATVHVLLSTNQINGTALIVGGDFTEIGGIGANRIARWDGGTWSALGSGCDDLVSALALYDDGAGPAVFAGGRFLAAGSANAARIAKWDGTSWSALGLGVSGMSGTSGPHVGALAVVDRGSGAELVVGGAFQVAGGVPAKSVASWNGSTWSAADWLGLGQIPVVTSLVVHDEMLYAGGVITGSVARYDGQWSAVGPPLSVATTAVRALGFIRAGLGSAPVLHVGGHILGSDGISIRNITRLIDGAWLPVSNALNGHVRSLVVDPGRGSDGPALYALGRFTAINGRSCRRIGRWDGAEWSSIGHGVGGGTDINVAAMLIRHRGDATECVVGGRFTTAGGATVNGIARWDGSTWSGFAGGIGLSTYNEIRALSSFDGGGGPTANGDEPFVAAGRFTQIGGTQASNIARWNGSAWLPLAAGLSAGAHALAVYDDGLGAGPTLYAGGDFLWSGGTLLSHVGRWDGAEWTALGGGLNGPVYALLVHETRTGPVLIVAGAFTFAGGVPASRIAVWNGVEWSPLGDGFDGGELTAVHALCHIEIAGEKAIVAGGSFAVVEGQSAANCAIWNGEAWNPISPGVTSDASPFVAAVSAFAVPGESTQGVWFGGGFMSSAHDDSRLALWQPCTDPDSSLGDLDGDGLVDGTDLSILLGSWGPCDQCAADINDDGVVDGDDLAALLGAWSP